MDHSLPGSSIDGDSPGRNTGVGCHALFQGTFPTHGLNPGFPHCKRVLYCLSYQGSPRILEWIAYPFSRGPSQESTWGLLHCRWILYQLSYPGSSYQKLLFSNPRNERLIHTTIWINLKGIMLGEKMPCVIPLI